MNDVNLSKKLEQGVGSVEQKRPFTELTTEEAESIVNGIVRTSKSEEEIRSKLNEAGFDASAAAVTSLSRDGMFMAMVMVWGPKGEIITGKPSKISHSE